MREIVPTYFFSSTRIFENVLTTVIIRSEDDDWISRTIFHAFMRVARRAGIPIMERRSVPLRDRMLYGLGRWLVFKPLMDSLGFSRIRVAYTAGEAIGPDIFDFYRSLGMNLKQIYGQTEAAVFVTIQPDGHVKADTVGTPAKEVEVKISDGGEVIYRSPGVFVGYYKNDAATRATKTAEGWVHTGDAGFFDSDGHLKIIDRAKDVGRLHNGAMFAPKYLENKLKFFQYIKEAYLLHPVRERIGGVGCRGWRRRRRLPGVRRCR